MGSHVPSGREAEGLAGGMGCFRTFFSYILRKTCLFWAYTKMRNGSIQRRTSFSKTVRSPPCGRCSVPGGQVGRGGELPSCVEPGLGGPCGAPVGASALCRSVHRRRLLCTDATKHQAPQSPCIHPLPPLCFQMGHGFRSVAEVVRGRPTGTCGWGDPSWVLPTPPGCRPVAT